MKSTINLRRLMNESTSLEKNSSEYSKMFRVQKIGDDLLHWHATVYGPQDSLYEGYEFDLDIKLPSNYPLSPPTVKFTTPIKHVNVNKNGDICLDILKNNWSSSQNIRSVLMSITVLMSEPNVDDALNSDLAEIYRSKGGYAKYQNLIKKECEQKARLAQI